ncbi:capsular polysaccharide export protein, LipB/KpsS family [Neobacillus cucumis]|uniref:capsular polysaccharide export protein, LipB/KpsS family n=1 Tax=Neobacillus cucumis TaxID=1740721 RepID=UPI0019624E75|nr:capsular polysaccharide biosynthesis protein [Neobacillus cucumis]MBM7652572.1 capsular polysaccharide export protein [Neobacillus cucumis]
MNLRLGMKRKVKKVIKFALLILNIISWYFKIDSKRQSTTALVFNVSKWKRPYIENLLYEYEIMFIPAEKSLFLLSPILKKLEKKVIIIWGFGGDQEICRYAETKGIPVYRIEDGFVRSVGLGSMHTPPYSICFDKKGMYFDSTKPSDLEDILNQYDFEQNPKLLNQSRKCIEMLINLGISKYNHLDSKSVHEIYGKKTKKRILVIGQVEDDASILKGCSKRITNNDLVRLAYQENPDAEIIYKPHPDVLTGRRPKQSDPNEIKHIAKVIQEPLSLVDSFKTIDHVYTITSLSGFEALLRGITVTTVGAPFYSGWGVTDDRQITGRRNRKLSVEEIFAGAYLLYPRYADPYTKEQLSLEETIKRIASNL